MPCHYQTAKTNGNRIDTHQYTHRRKQTSGYPAGSGDLEVLATPVMMALMENAAMLAVKEALDEGMTTVGGHISPLTSTYGFG